MSERRGEAAARAAAWALAAAALREPDGEIEASLRDEAFGAEAGAALRVLDPAGERGLDGAWGRFREAFLRSGPEGVRADRAAVFGHAVRGPCPPYELEYGDEHFLGKSHRLGDVAAFYRAFGVEVARDARERADHAAVEAEFLSLVAAKEARAAARGEEERAAICRDASRRFLEEHLGRFLPSVARRAGERSPGGPVHRALEFALRVAESVAAGSGATLGDPEMELRAIGTPDEETVVACGSGDPLAAGSPRTRPGEIEV